MEFTGERYQPALSGQIKYEHWHRYALSAQFVTGKTVLDIASGEGYGAALLAARAQFVYGVDIDLQVVEHANQRYGNNSKLRYLVGSCEAIPLPDHSVDVVTSFETIEHHDKHEEMMQEIKRVLKPEGILILSSPNKLTYSDLPGYQNPYHVKELYHEEFINLITRYFQYFRVYGQRFAVGSFVYGLQEVDSTSLDTYTLNDEQLTQKIPCLDNPLYFIAICADEPLPLQPSLDSIYIDNTDDLLKLQTDDRLAMEQKLHEELSLYHETVLRQNQHIAEQERLVDSLMQQITEVNDSQAWQLMQLLWRWRLRLAPPQSIRDRILHFLLNSLRPRKKMQTEPSLQQDVDEILAQVETEIPRNLVTGKGTELYLSGWCFHLKHQLSKLEILINETAYPATVFGAARADVKEHYYPKLDMQGYSYNSGFWATIPISEPPQPETVELSLQVTLSNGAKLKKKITDITVSPSGPADPQKPSLGRNAAGLTPPIVICMATHNPPLALFCRQIKSIIDQSYHNWVCIISDDASRPEVIVEMQKIIAQDSRFIFSPAPNRFGFYLNFERCLSLVPEQAELVALCDQDDYWYPDKLQTLIAHFDSETLLVYSDMRIVSEQGEILADSYWMVRQNNSTDLWALLLANTVPGAASMFRKELLDYLLPFPPKLGDLFHDHWIGVMALALGKIRSIARPLYDYTRHSGNVSGYGEQLRKPPLVMLHDIFRQLMSPEGRAGARNIYYDHVLRTGLMARLLSKRAGPKLTKEKQKTLEVLGSLDNSAATLFWLAVRGLQDWRRIGVTNGAEFRLIQGVMWRYYLELISRFEWQR
ncbi:MAG: methyltransferase domain-containing protein [Acidobacteria bacterium]|nr:methyltransferase domain-containing protein [Acidobacteriota bacterium]MBI3423627.1 methyltransferase domain-containing protein [Acidobacteriota bacterium]